MLYTEWYYAYALPTLTPALPLAGGGSRRSPLPRREGQGEGGVN